MKKRPKIRHKTHNQMMSSWLRRNKPTAQAFADTHTKEETLAEYGVPPRIFRSAGIKLPLSDRETSKLRIEARMSAAFLFMRVAGASMQQVISEMHIGKDTLQRHGVQPPRAFMQEKIQKVDDYISEGLPQREAARRAGVSRRTWQVYKWKSADTPKP